MKSLTCSVILFAVAITSLAVGNLLLKLGMDRFGALTGAGTPAAQALLKSPGLPVGIVLMIVQFICTLTLFKWGWDATVVLPILGLSYAVMAILGQPMLGEPVNATRWLGIILIMVGVFFVTRSVVPAKVH